MLPCISVSLEDFNCSKVKLLKYLHLFNEELRLSRCFRDLHEDMTFFLLNLSFYLKEANQEHYVEHYLKLQPRAIERLHSSPILHTLFEVYGACPQPGAISKGGALPARDPSHFFNETLDCEVFDVLDSLGLCFEQRRGLPKVPPIFEQTCRVFKLVSILFQCAGPESFQSIRQSESGAGLDSPESAVRSFHGLGPIGQKGTLSKIPFLPHPHQLGQLSHRPRDWHESLVLHSRAFKMVQKAQECEALEDDWFIESLPNSSTFQRLFKFFCERNLRLAEIEGLCDGLEFIYKGLLRIIKKECLFKHHKLGQAAWELLGREDMSLNGRRVAVDLTKKSFLGLERDLLINEENTMLDLGGRVSGQFAGSKSHLNFFGQNSAQRGRSASIKHSLMGSRPSLGPKLAQSQERVAMIEIKGDLKRNHNFSKDDVLFKEIYKIFEVSDVFYLKSKQLDSLIKDEPLTEEKIQNEVQDILKWDINSRLSTFVGRGALDLNTEKMALTEVVEIPKIGLTAKIKKSSANVTYVFDRENPANYEAMSWGEFHNGVAVGLKISRQALEMLDKQGVRTWIDYQKTEYKRYDHAGLLFGLGLQGFFSCFTIADIYFNLRTCNDSRIISTILGLGTSRIPANRINMSEIILKAFNLHLEFNYSSTSEVKISRVVQSAAMVSIGLYHLQMSKKTLSETMLAQIEARPFNENNRDRECHSLCAGFALGIINLARGTDIPSVRDVKLDERLFQYIHGGRSPSLGGGRDGSEPGPGQYQSSNLLENSVINTQLTAPGALVALMLIHLKSNDKAIAARIKLPDTVFEVINCNPAQATLKTLARCLILWDSIRPTAEFLAGLVPETVRFLIFSDSNAVLDKFYLNPNFADLDYHNLSLIYYNILAGGAMALALKYAGSGDAAVRDVLLDQILTVTKLKTHRNEFITDISAQNRLDEYSQLNILSSLALSVAIVTAGYCDLLVFKTLKVLRRRIKNSTTCEASYGFNMAVNMAIGFLFLGNGSSTFGNSDLQILYLLMSIFPSFPATVNDNRFHLQALRHFYVLALQDNLFHIIDIDSKRPLKAPVQLVSVCPRTGAESKRKLISPLFLNSSHPWKSLKVLDDDYYPLHYSFSQSESQRFARPRFLFVKKKYPFSVNLRNIKNFIFSKLSLENFSRSSLLLNVLHKCATNQKSCCSSLLTSAILFGILECLSQKSILLKPDANEVNSIVQKYYFSSFKLSGLDLGFLSRAFQPLSRSSLLSAFSEREAFASVCEELFVDLKLKFNQNYECRHQKFRYLISMVYHILKKDKSAQLALFEKFLMNREFSDCSAVLQPDHSSLSSAKNPFDNSKTTKERASDFKAISPLDQGARSDLESGSLSTPYNIPQIATNLSMEGHSVMMISKQHHDQAGDAIRNITNSAHHSSLHNLKMESELTANRSQSPQTSCQANSAMPKSQDSQAKSGWHLRDMPQSLLDARLICSFNEYLSLIVNKRSHQLSCVFDEWDEIAETKRLRGKLAAETKLISTRSRETFQKYLLNDCRSLLEFGLSNFGPNISLAFRDLFLGLTLTRFKGKHIVTAILKLISKMNLQNPKEVIAVLAQQHGIVLHPDIHAIVFDLYNKARA